jgi:integrase
VQPNGFHQLRHSAASRWVTLGVSLKVVAEQLGHVDTAMVERYCGHPCSRAHRTNLLGTTWSWSGQGGKNQTG